MRPTNCGSIPNGTMGELIHGPLEAVLIPLGKDATKLLSNANG